jgi:hypothetical protein
MYMFCPYVISTPVPVTSRVKKVNSLKDSFLVHSSHNFTPKRNELGYHCSLSVHNCISLGTSFLLQQRDRVVFTVQDY